jgi:hypothetical protein
MQYVIHFEKSLTTAEKVANSVVLAGGAVFHKEQDFLVANMDFAQRQQLISHEGVTSIATDEYQYFEV